MYPNLKDQQHELDLDFRQFRLNRINEIYDYFIAEIRERELMSKRLSKYIALFHCFDKSLIVFYATSDGISTASFAAVIGGPIGIANSSFTFVFSLTTGIIKKRLKTTQNKKKKHHKILILARSKLNSMESITSKATNEISHEDFTTIFNEETNYRELKESIKMMKSQRSDTEKNNLIGESKKIGIDKIITNYDITIII